MENSLFLNPLGQSGNMLSPKYDNLLELWSDADGSYMQMRMSGYPSDEVLTLNP
jgi:penicillin amidase